MELHERAADYPVNECESREEDESNARNSSRPVLVVGVTY